MLSIIEEDARDLEFQRGIQAACEVFVQATNEQRSAAKSHYLKLLGAFAARVLERDPRRHHE